MKYWQTFRKDTRAVYTIASRRHVQHLVSAFIGLSACALFGTLERQIIICAACILASEAMTYVAMKTLNENDNKIHLGHSIVSICVCIISGGAFVTVGGLMILQGSLASIITGMIVSVATLAHMAIVYSAHPIHNFVQINVGMTVMLSFIYKIHEITVAPSKEWEWALTTVVLVIFIGNLMSLRNHTQKLAMDLEQARRKINARLKEVEYFANHDDLTSLLNRAAFKQEVTTQYGQKIREAAVVMLDMNGFKPINDGYSHEAGDSVLQAVAQRIKHHCKKGDFAARFGGDEFVIILHNETGRLATVERVQKIMDDIARPIPWKNSQLKVSCAAGVSLPNPEGESLKSMLTAADMAMFRCKSNKSQNPEVYVKAFYKPVASQQDRNDLISAMDSGELRPFYQPKIDIATGSIVGFEALARWQTADNQILKPQNFLSQIEELNLHTQLLHTVLAHVCQDMLDWLNQGVDPGQVSVNVSPSTLTNHIDTMHIITTLKSFPELAERIVLEITEDAFVGRSSDKICEAIHMLRSNGFMVSLDDFGTGFSSLTHLQELEFDEIKIDTSFVKMIGQSKSSNVLVRGILTMAQSLKINVVAEGVETETQRQILMDMGCKVAQGFLWSYSVHPELIPTLIEQGVEAPDTPYGPTEKEAILL